MYRSVLRSLPVLLPAVAVGHSLRPTLRCDGITETLKEKAHELKEGLEARSPLKPQSPAGIAGARTSHNPSTSMNHGQTAGESDRHPDPVILAQKKASKSANDKETSAHIGQSPTAKIKAGHDLDSEGKRVPRDDIKSKSKSQAQAAGASAGAAAAAAAASAKAPSETVTDGLQEKQAEAQSEEAFNEETGEINWDCPCLGGMAHGPCGEDFKAAFSCFVYSKEEPKGADCLDKFKGMQECFKQHPEIYGELTKDDETPEGKLVE